MGTNGATLFLPAQADDQETPDDLFAAMHAEFHFDIDAAAHSRNHKLERYFSLEDGIDALKQDWLDYTYWLNPPWGERDLHAFMGKVVEARAKGATVVCLVPVKTDQTWWSYVVTWASEARYIEGRLVFKGFKHGARNPAAIIIFRPGDVPDYPRQFTADKLGRRLQRWR